MSTTHDRSKETKSEELQTKRRASEAEPPHKELTPDVVLPLGAEARALTDPRFSSSANNGRKAQVVLRLQRTHGNAFVQRLLSKGALPQQGGKLPDLRDRAANQRGPRWGTAASS